MAEFIVKDSGERIAFDGGMVRDITDGKIDYSLVYDGPLFQRWAAHMTRGAQKYKARNWLKASGPEEKARFLESLIRHFSQFVLEELGQLPLDEQGDDHASSIVFNLNGYLLMKARLDADHQEAGHE